MYLIFIVLDVCLYLMIHRKIRDIYRLSNANLQRLSSWHVAACSQASSILQGKQWTDQTKKTRAAAQALLRMDERLPGPGNGPRRLRSSHLPGSPRLPPTSYHTLVARRSAGSAVTRAHLPILSSTKSSSRGPRTTRSQPLPLQRSCHRRWPRDSLRGCPVTVQPARLQALSAVQEAHLAFLPAPRPPRTSSRSPR